VAAPQARRRVLPWLFVGGVALLVAYAAGVLDPLITKFSLAFHSRGTYDDRLSTFHTLVAQQNAQGWTVRLLGQPFGAGFARREPNGLIETFAPHNYYVVLNLRVGLIGVVMFTVALLRGLWISVGRHDTRAIGWAATIMVYCFAYNLPFYAGICLAVAITAAQRREVVGQELDVPRREPVGLEAR
jgi:hypothetical protein